MHRDVKEQEERDRTNSKRKFQQREQERKRKIESLEISSKQSNLESAKRLRHLQKAEAIKMLFKKLRSMQHIPQKTGVARIEIPNPEGSDPTTCEK
jgi:hypothetical protein